jgi:hypothetical protein
MEFWGRKRIWALSSSRLAGTLDVFLVRLGKTKRRGGVKE